LTRAARDRAQRTGETYTQARDAVIDIHERAEGFGLTWAEAEAEHDDPLNELLCDTCGWTVGMACPECPGCGCYTGRCSGWRHGEYMHDDERHELAQEAECGECGTPLSSLGPYNFCDCGECTGDDAYAF
jgi:hypothetical protein